MSHEQEIVLLLTILAVNTVLALFYLFYGVLKQREVKKHIILSFFMIMCPLVGPLFLLLSHIFYYVFFDSNIDLSAITFSKDRVDVLERPDVEEEINVVPIEEAIMIDDKENLRRLLLNVLRGDITKSIRAVTKALNSADSEASHYAASAIMDIMNEFQKTMQHFQAELDNNPKDLEINQLYIDYLIKMLQADFLSKLELRTYVYTLMHITQNLYTYHEADVKVTYYSALIDLLFQIGDLQNANIWLERLLSHYPDHIDMYRCVLRYYYNIKDRNHYFYYLNQLKSSNIPIDKDLLELIRIFS